MAGYVFYGAECASCGGQHNAYLDGPAYGLFRATKTYMFTCPKTGKSTPITRYKSIGFAEERSEDGIDCIPD